MRHCAAREALPSFVEPAEVRLQLDDLVSQFVGRVGLGLGGEVLAHKTLGVHQGFREPAPRAPFTYLPVNRYCLGPQERYGG